MSVASVRVSGRRDNLPVFRIAAGNKGGSGSFSKPVASRYWSRSSSSLWRTGSSFSLPPFSLNRSKNRFPLGVIIFDPEVPDGPDLGERVGQHPEQGAVTQACMRGGFNRVKKHDANSCAVISLCQCASNSGRDLYFAEFLLSRLRAPNSDFHLSQSPPISPTTCAKASSKAMLVDFVKHLTGVPGTISRSVRPNSCRYSWPSMKTSSSSK
jgi:hypothetical protein